ncbi:hypothetical protein R1sor_008337 [Riccia sorocarpa]|uniref:Uncharacterized protein n=1 Tax=Riccia sorocarpa TaxID=122646 RepID=A0ABD3HV91_9MARC
MCFKDVRFPSTAVDVPNMPSQAALALTDAIPTARVMPDLNKNNSTSTGTQYEGIDDLPEVSMLALVVTPELEEGEIIPTQVINPDHQTQNALQVWSLPLPPTNALPIIDPNAPILPLEQMIIAKRRVLFNGNTSPHEEALNDQDRRVQHKTTIRIPQGHFSALGRRAVRNFIRKVENLNAIVALQELKVKDKSILEARLSALIPNANIYVDYTVSGRGGAALLIPSSVTVLDHGVSGTGNAVWVTIDSVLGPIKLISIHAPNTKELRT